MGALIDIHPVGATNFLGAFWRQVRNDLHYVPVHTEGRRVHAAPDSWLLNRAQTLAWVLEDSLSYDEAGLPISFRAWCRFGGLNLDPVWWRELLLSGEPLPSDAGLKYEDE